MTAFDRLLETAFNAGANYEHEPSNPDFDEWRESISGVEREPIRAGDTIEIISNEPGDREVRGLRFMVAKISNQCYYFVHDGEPWYVLHDGAKKVSE